MLSIVLEGWIPLTCLYNFFIQCSVRSRMTCDVTDIIHHPPSFCYCLGVISGVLLLIMVIKRNAKALRIFPYPHDNNKVFHRDSRSKIFSFLFFGKRERMVTEIHFVQVTWTFSEEELDNCTLTPFIVSPYHNHWLKTLNVSFSYQFKILNNNE